MKQGKYGYSGRHRQREDSMKRKRRMPCKDKDRDWSNVPTNKEYQGLPEGHQKLEGRHKQIFFKAQKRTNHAGTLVLDLYLPNL